MFLGARLGEVGRSGRRDGPEYGDEGVRRRWWEHGCRLDAVWEVERW